MDSKIFHGETCRSHHPNLMRDCSGTITPKIQLNLQNQACTSPIKEREREWERLYRIILKVAYSIPVEDVEVDKQVQLHTEWYPCKR